jgi:hypothetical protein
MSADRDEERRLRWGQLASDLADWSSPKAYFARLSGREWKMIIEIDRARSQAQFDEFVAKSR